MLCSMSACDAEHRMGRASCVVQQVCVKAACEAPCALSNATLGACYGSHVLGCAKLTVPTTAHISTHYVMMQGSMLGGRAAACILNRHTASSWASWGRSQDPQPWVPASCGAWPVHATRPQICTSLPYNASTAAAMQCASCVSPLHGNQPQGVGFSQQGRSWRQCRCSLAATRIT